MLRGFFSFNMCAHALSSAHNAVLPFMRRCNGTI